MYNNFELYNPFVTVKLIVWAMFAGFVIASLMAVYNKRVLGRFVKSLLLSGCVSPETSKTIVDLGYGTDWFIKNALRTDTVLRRFVVRLGGDAGSGNGENVADSGNNGNAGDAGAIAAASENAANAGVSGDCASNGAGNGASNGGSESAVKSRGQRPQRRSHHEQIDFLTAKFYIPEELKYRAEVRYAGKGSDFIALLICIVILAIAAFFAIFAIPELLTLIDNFLGTI